MALKDNLRPAYVMIKSKDRKTYLETFSEAKMTICNGLSDENIPKYMKMSKKDQTIVDSLSEVYRNGFVQAPKDCRLDFLQLSDEEKAKCIEWEVEDQSVFLSVSEQAKELFLNLSEDDKNHCRSMPKERKQDFIEFTSSKEKEKVSSECFGLSQVYHPTYIAL